MLELMSSICDLKFKITALRLILYLLLFGFLFQNLQDSNKSASCSLKSLFAIRI
jgi:hypothetical protein